jgi:hypothetical protein
MLEEWLQAVDVLRTIIQQIDTFPERLSTTWVASSTEFRDIRLDYHHFERLCSSCGASHRPYHAQQASAQVVYVDTKDDHPANRYRPRAFVDDLDRQFYGIPYYQARLPSL